jgi:threonine/homoserine/homoserine lactone efflux protein
MELFIRGLVLGFAIAAPVGPIGLLCIQRTLSQGRLVGLVSGLGAATADAIYGAVAAFGLSLLTAFLVEQQMWLGLAGGLFLCYLGVRTVTAAPAERAAAAVESRGLLGAYGTTLALTLTNPMTILAFVAIFAGAGLATTGGDSIARCCWWPASFCGSAAWWLLLSFGVSLLRGFVTAPVLRWINWIAGGVIVAFGVIAILRGFGWV